MKTTLLCLTLAALSAQADESAKEISQKSRDRGALNLVGLNAELKLVTTTAEGKAKEQVLTTSSRKIEGKTHALSRFSVPAPVAGVAILTVEQGGGQADDISLYLPKLKRVRKVAKSDRGKSFMDTDFTYSDITNNGGANDDDFKRLPDEKIDGRDAYVLKGPAGADTPYSEVTVCIDKASYVPLKVEYLDKNGKLLKRYRSLKLKAFKDRTLAAESVMENVQTGSKTQMTVLKLEDSTLGDDAFTERALERG